MNLTQIQNHLAEKGTPVSVEQAKDILTELEQFYAEMKACQPDKNWIFDIQQVGKNDFEFEYSYRVTRQIECR